jgi:hypothetical protein
MRNIVQPITDSRSSICICFMLLTSHYSLYVPVGTKRTIKYRYQATSNTYFTNLPLDDTYPQIRPGESSQPRRRMAGSTTFRYEPVQTLDFMVQKYIIMPYKGRGGKALHIENLSIRWRWMVSFIAIGIYTRGCSYKAWLSVSCTAIQTVSTVLYNRSGRAGEEKMPGIEP